MSSTPTTRRVVLCALGLMLLAGCAAQADPHTAPHTAGFWLGLWQGLILPVTFVVSLFNDSVGVYEVRHSGHLYDLGFVLGAGGLSAPGFLSHARRTG